MSTSLLSPFERLLVQIQQPISVYIRLCHPTYSPTFPATHLLSFLPLETKLSLRIVSPKTKAWIDSADPSVFSNLGVLFPLNTFTTEELLALHNTSPQCEHLTLTVSQHIPLPKPSELIPLPPFPRLQHLDLTAPNHDPFHSILSFRLALQRANPPLLTHLTLTNLSLPGILALRCGTFTSFTDTSWTSKNIWHGLKELNVKALRWWDDKPQEKSHNHNHNHDHEAEQWKTDHENWRTNTRVLHDWLHCFATNAQLHRFSFEWLDSEGPNPFLLDETVARDGRREWFSAPGVRWNGLRELGLGNVVISAVDVRRLKERMEGLQTIVVVPECLDYGLGGKMVVVDGEVWVELVVEGRRVGLWEETERERWRDEGEAMRGSWVESGVRGGEDRKSMVLPFMLDLSPEEGTFL